MKLEEVERLELYSDGFDIHPAGDYVRYENIESLYNYQQDIINKLVSNSQSQYETNQVLLNRLLELKSWLSVELEKRKEDLGTYEDTDAEYFRYLEGIIDGLELVTEKIN